MKSQENQKKLRLKKWWKENCLGVKLKIKWGFIVILLKELMDQLDVNKGDIYMNDLLINIDGKATQTAVEKVLRQYRTYKLTTPDDLMPRITAKYTLEMLISQM